MNLKRIFDSINKVGDKLTLNLVFRNFPESKLTDLEGNLNAILDGWIQEDYERVSFGKSSVSVATGLGWDAEEEVDSYVYSTESPLDIRPGTEEDWLDSLAEKIAGRCYINIEAIPVDFVIYLSFHDKEGELVTYECYKEV